MHMYQFNCFDRTPAWDRQTGRQASRQMDV